MEIAWARVLPVIISIAIIIGVAILREYSKTIAAIVVTMPINIPLGLWVVYAGEGGSQEAIQQFTSAIFINIWPTILFLIVVWLAARAGWGLVPMIAAGYAGWAVGLGAVLILRQVTGM
jgi:mannose/fructose/N-acetylgalactosamine-specific phosphotransferase system component IID